MHFGVFDLFKIGVGPSSSHTVGPMKAARTFMARLEEAGQADGLLRLEAELYGSLALTGLGHGTDKAVLLGLEGSDPSSIDPDGVEARLAAIRETGRLNLPWGGALDFNIRRDLQFRGEIRLPFHSNAMKLIAYGEGESVLREEIWYSIGGGFVIDEHEAGRNSAADVKEGEPFPFDSAEDLLKIGEREGLMIHEIKFELDGMSIL